MAFVSLRFILFMLAVMILYFIFPKKYRWFSLLVSSYVFFYLSSGYLLLILFGTTVFTYVCGLAMHLIDKSSAGLIKKKSLTGDAKKKEKKRAKAGKKAVMIVGTLSVLALLIYLKYFNFLAQTINTIAKGDLIELRTDILLPIGISFYTLQAMSYLIDIQRGKIEADKNPLKFMLFMSFFPQIVQGPIARYDHLAHQLYEGHPFDYKRVTFGIQLILWGWFKKCVIADRVAIPANMIFDNHQNYTGIIAFLGAVLYGLQVYADFSGGMDIARGFSQILGIDLALNFKQPYFATSIEDFWRRWHITLGAWMRDYVFYPMSLSKPFGFLSKIFRKIFGQFVGKRIPAFISMFFVYFLVGIWHGPDLKYIAYGIWNGIFIMAGILFVDLYAGMRKLFRIDEKTISWRCFQIVRTFFIISLGRFFSRADSFETALQMLSNMCIKPGDLSVITDGSLLKLGLNNASIFVLLVSLGILFAVDVMHEKGIEIRESIAKQHLIFRWIIYYGAIIAILIFGIWGPGAGSALFIYEQF